MTHYDLVTSNKRKSTIIIALFMAFIVGASYLMATGLGYGLDVVGIGLIVSVVMSFASYWWSDSIILSISGARPAKRTEFFDFYTVTENLAARP
jgi:heat shock protein HtpX